MIVKKSKEKLIIEALDIIFGRTVKVIISDGKITHWEEPNEIMPSVSQIDEVIKGIIDEEPMEALRKERDNKLAECDWRMAPDYPKPDQSEWIEYRSKLRDIPSLIKDGILETPTINENNLLVFNQWPQMPNN